MRPDGAAVRLAQPGMPGQPGGIAAAVIRVVAAGRRLAEQPAGGRGQAEAERQQAAGQQAPGAAPAALENKVKRFHRLG